MIPKFRFFIKNDNRMIGLDQYSQITFDMVGSNVGVAFPDGQDEWYQDDEIFLMQSTGLKDKNGVEIFDGDVVTFEDADDIENVYINVGSIEWCQGGFFVKGANSASMDDLLDGEFLEVEVIGNIYENPELLEVPHD